MPFLGQDWRSPGDQWVRTNEGWEKLRLWRVKLFENLNENILARLIRLALTVTDWSEQNKDNYRCQHQPHIYFVKGTSRERKILTSLSEAFIRLDMSGAVKDIQRFNYVCKLMEIILKNKLGDLSGTSQRHVFNILQEMVEQVLRTHNFVNIMQELLQTAVKALTDAHYTHIGSSQLWSQHKESINKMVDKLDKFSIKERENDGKPTFADLPPDVIRCILERLSDHRDIMRTGITHTNIYCLAKEQLLWKQLCLFHFTNRQILTFLTENSTDIDWEYIYRRCVKRFGRRDIFADSLSQCRGCDCIFWQSLGHPCPCKETPATTPLPPGSFLHLFHV